MVPGGLLLAVLPEVEAPGMAATPVLEPSEDAPTTAPVPAPAAAAPV